MGLDVSWVIMAREKQNASSRKQQEVSSAFKKKEGGKKIAGPASLGSEIQGGGARNLCLMDVQTSHDAPLHLHLE